MSSLSQGMGVMLNIDSYVSSALSFCVDWGNSFGRSRSIRLCCHQLVFINSACVYLLTGVAASSVSGIVHPDGFFNALDTLIGCVHTSGYCGVWSIVTFWVAPCMMPLNWTMMTLALTHKHLHLALPAIPIRGV